MTSDKVAALQCYYLNQYNEIFWIITRVGGCIMQQQLCRLLNNNLTDTTKNTAFVKKLEEAQLIKTKKIGSNKVLIITYPVLQYFNINRTVKINGSKIKRSAIIMERFLQEGYYKKDPIELKKRMDKTSALAYFCTGEPHLRCVQRYIQVLQSRGWSVDGLRHEETVLYQRMDYQTKSLLYENYPPLELDKDENELDLYNLECQNTFISHIRFDKQDDKKLQVHMDIYNIHDKDALCISKLIMNTQRAVTAIFADYSNNNFADVFINVYNLNACNADYEKRVYERLSYENEYIGNEELVKSRVKFVFFDTKTTLFSNIDPCSIV